MTGFGKATVVHENKVFTIEIKALNSRYLDIVLRLPLVFKAKEVELRQWLKNKLSRGKVDITVAVESAEGNVRHRLNKVAIKSYYKDLLELTDLLNHSQEDLLSVILRLPDTTIQSDDTEVDKEAYNVLRSVIESAIEQLNHFRLQEGQSLENDLRERIDHIRQHLAVVEQLAPERGIRMKQKLEAKIEENLRNEKIDRNRLEQELIYYLERLDINEEIVRLKNHCQYFESELATEAKQVKGKTLGFICQEIGREINTIGAKANDAQIQEFVIKMKDELEKMKEQTMNIM